MFYFKNKTIFSFTYIIVVSNVFNNSIDILFQLGIGNCPRMCLFLDLFVNYFPNDFYSLWMISKSSCIHIQSFVWLSTWESCEAV